MFEIVCVTNRKLCQEDFLTRIEKIARAHPSAILLREKDLPEQEYLCLAKEIIKICKEQDVPCILHTFIYAARMLNCPLHLPATLLQTIEKGQMKGLPAFGVSCHSLDEAKAAESAGASYVTAGHIFETDCKKGLNGRGIAFLSEITSSVNLPVLAIGGIRAENIALVKRAGARGACVMSGAFACEDVNKYFHELRNI